MQILIIEDDLAMAKSLQTGFIENGFSTTHCDDGQTAFEMLLAAPKHYDIVIADRMLPRLDGLSLTQKLRENQIEVPIILLTALSEVDHRVEGLLAGADDYLGKPFAFAELLARVKVLLRQQEKNRRVYSIGDLTLNQLTREVHVNGKLVALQPKEFDLLLYLLKHPNTPIARNTLLKEVWGLDFDPQTNVVDVHISRLRQKIDKSQRRPIIHTLRGIGYQLSLED